MGAHLIVERLRDPEGVELERVGDHDDPRLGGSIRQQVSSAVSNTSRSVGRVIGIRASLEAARGQHIDPERFGVELGDQPLGRQVGKADTDDVAVALVRNVENHQPGNDGTFEIGLGLDSSAGR